MDAINPVDGTLQRTYPALDWDQVDERLRRASARATSWRDSDPEMRADLVRSLAGRLRTEREEHAHLMVREMGKPITQARSEISKCAWLCDYYADNAHRMLLPVPIDTEARESYVSYRPLGGVLGVMPWNFPYWQVFRFAVPALLAGNVVLLKPARNVPGCGVAIEAAFRAAGLPEDAFSTLLMDHGHLERAIEHPAVAAVTLTGSVDAGRAVARKAGEMLKKTVLELGGSDPYLILEDADLDHAATVCARSRLINNGQSCIAAKRFIVVRRQLPGFRDRLVERLSAAAVGDPARDDTELGPLAREDLRDRLHGQVGASIEAGARLLLGGTLPGRPGWWYPATVLDDVRPGMPAFDEELFGPVAALIAAEDEDEAIALANRSRYGLGAAVFTRDIARGRRIAETRLEAGACFVNGMVRSDPRLPFGGIKDSGYGRELGAEGIRAFVNVKSVYVHE